MYQTTSTFTEQLNKNGRTFRARMTVGGEQINEIKGYTLTTGSCGSDTFSVGCVFASYVDITLGRIDTALTGREIYLETGLLLPDGTVEYIPMGYFTPQKPSDVGKERDQIKVSAVDRITTMCSGLYVATVTFPCTIQGILDDVATQAGVEIVCDLDTNGVVQKSMDALQYRDVLGYLAGLLGGFCYADREGRIKIASYPTESSQTIEKSWIRSLSGGDKNYQIGRLTVVVEEGGTDADGNEVEGISYSYGTTGEELSTSNPYMTQTLFDAMKGKIAGYSFCSGEVQIFGNPLLNPEDAVTAVNYMDQEFFFPCMSIVQEYDGGIITTISTPGTAESDETAKGPIQKTIEQIQTEVVLAKELIAKKMTVDQADIRYASIEKLNAVEATIGTLKGQTAEFEQLKSENAEFKTTVAESLKAQEAKIENLTVGNANLEKLIADKANIKDLEAIKITAGDLTVKVGNIETLLNGNLTSDNIHSLNITADKFTVDDGFIKSAMIENLEFGKLTGVDINTTKMTVHSDDGKSTWKDNTIQISDSARVRVQMGKDASGDYNIYIWDKDGKLMFDPLYGIQEDGIKRPIIRNDMVSEDAAISGSKLDINSVVQEVNGSTTKLKATTIYLDDKNQTLDVTLKGIETTMTGLDEITKSNKSSIELTQEKIETLVSQDEIIKGEQEKLTTQYSELNQSFDEVKTKVEYIESDYVSVEEANEESERLGSEIYRQSTEAVTTAKGFFVEALEEYTTKDELDEYKKKNSADLQVLSDQVKIDIQTEMGKGASKVVTSTGVVVDENGLTVDRSDSELATTISHDGMRVKHDGEEVLAATDEGVDAKNLHATTYLIVGQNARFEDYQGDMTACYYIGG